MRKKILDLADFLQIVDHLDPTKKTTSFICTTAISVQHIGFAIGPFEHVDLAEFRESDEDERLGHNAVPVLGFCLPGRVDDLRNTCLPMAKVNTSHIYPAIPRAANRSLGCGLFCHELRRLSFFGLQTMLR